MGMPPTNTLQATFSGGEFAPALWSRVDIKKYATALRTAKNIIVHPTGGASNRPGMMFVASTKGSAANKKSRLIPFVFSNSESYVIEFGEHYCRFFVTTGIGGGQVVVNNPNVWSGSTTYAKDDYVSSGGNTYRSLADSNLNHSPSGSPTYWEVLSVYEIYSDYSADELADLKFTQSADTIFIVHPTHKPQKLVRYGSTDWAFVPFTNVGGPFGLSNIDDQKKLTASATTGTGITITYANAVDANDGIFAAGHVGSLLRLKHYVLGQSASKQFATGTAGDLPTTGSIKCGGTWRVNASVSTTGTFTVSFDLLRLDDGLTDIPANWKVTKTFSGVTNTYGEIDGYCQLKLRVNTVTGCSLNVDVSADPYEHSGIAEITGFTNSKTVTAKAIKTLGDVTATDDYALGAWSTVHGYPKAVTFYEDRLCFLGTKNEPSGVWFSKSGDYADFGVSAPLEDTDGIGISLPSRRMNAVQSAVALHDLVVLTASNEWAIGATNGSVFTPTSVQTKIQSYHGASSVDPVLLGNSAIVIQPMSTVVRAIVWDFQSGGYASDNISIFSSHLLEGHTIVDMTYCQEPDSLVWFLRSDGKLISLTYMKEQEVLAWTWSETAGQVEAVCSIPSDGYDQLWCVVNRNGARSVECLTKRMKSTSPADQIFMDAAVYVHSDTAFNTVTGLAHLEGQTVTVLADGNVLPPMVVTSGALDLGTMANTAVVGIPFKSVVETLNIELQTPTGSAQGQLIKVPQVVMRFANSRGGFIGPDADHLQEVKQRDGGNYGDPIQLFTGDYRLNLGGGYDHGGRVYFEQADPLPFTILSIIPTVTVGGM